MALTVAQALNTVVGNQRMTVTSVTFDDSYPTGGEALTAADLGLNVIDQAIVYATSGYAAEWAGDLLVVYASAGTEVTDATDLQTLTVQVLAFGS